MIINCFTHTRQLKWTYYTTGINDPILTSDRINSNSHIYDFICVNPTLFEMYDRWEIKNDS